MYTPIVIIENDPLLEKYGLYPSDTFKNYPEVLANLKKVYPKFTDIDMNVSSGNKVMVFQDGRKMILMEGCYPHACSGSEKVALYDPVNNEIYLHTLSGNYYSKSDDLVKKVLSEQLAN